MGRIIGVESIATRDALVRGFLICGSFIIQEEGAEWDEWERRHLFTSVVQTHSRPPRVRCSCLYGGVHGARGWIQDLISMGLSFTGSFIIIKPNCAVHFFFFYFILLGGIGLKNSSFFHVAQSHRNLDFMELYVVRVHERYSQLCARSSHTCERLAWRETDCVVKQSQNIQQCHYYCTTRIDTGHQIKFFWDSIKKISAGGSLSLRVMYWMTRANSYSRYHKKSHIKHMIFESRWWRTTTMTHERLLFYWGFIMLLSNRERIVVWPFHMRSNRVRTWN